MDEKRTKEVLDFLLSSYRAKMAIDNSSEACPFDFSSFLSTWKEKGMSWSDLRSAIKRDLDPLINQGLFDSILPYLTASVNQSTANREFLETAKRQSSNPIISEEFVSVTPSRKSVDKDSKQKSVKRDEPDDESIEIVIHVCDEAKGLRQDFRCIQSTLIQEMGYFSKVAVKGQRLRDMDISVHCDISVFDWLMKWIKSGAGNGKNKSEIPSLEPVNVIGLMVSAEFLQMPTLTCECIKFTSENIDQVILKSPNLGCLNESLTNRLSKHFDNLHMETHIMSVDKNDRITSRLYTQFIMSLNDTDLDMNRGHFGSTAALFRCFTCGKLLINDVASKVPCSTMRFDCRGRLYSSHVKDQSWSLVSYIRDLKKDLKSWRKVYWRLWATVHFLCCSICQLYFPVKEFGSCRYHPQPPQLSKTILSSSSNAGDVITKKVEKPLAEEECINPFRRHRQISQENLQPTEVTVEITNLAFGTHACCKRDGFKFHPLPPTNGCKFRDHSLTQYAEDDPIIQRIVQLRDLIVSPPEEPRKPFEWGGIVDLTPLKLPITPSPSPWSLGTSRPGFGIQPGHPAQASPFQPQHSSSTDSTSLSDTEETTYTDHREFPYHPSRATPPYLNDFWIWNPEFTTRYNQDMQREREEKLMTDLELMLSQRVSLDSSGSSSLHNMRFGYLSRRASKNIGGSFIKLEEKWKEEALRNHGKPQQQSRQGAKSAKP